MGIRLGGAEQVSEDNSKLTMKPAKLGNNRWESMHNSMGVFTSVNRAYNGRKLLL